MDAIRPDYDGAWIGALVPALLRGQPAPWLPSLATDAPRRVLLVLDGLGWSALEAHLEALPNLAAMARVRATSVVPTTTATALTSITTGLPPAAHGILGYRMRVGGQVLNVLAWRVRGERTVPDAEQVQPHRPFLGESVPVATRGEFRETGFTTAHLRGAEWRGWRTTSALVEQVRRAVHQGASFVYAYYDGIDKIAHEHGLRDGFFAAELAATDRLVGELLAVLPTDCALVVTADHGQVHVGDAVVDLDPLDRFVAQYSGEGRFRTLHARSGKVRDLAAAAREIVGDAGWVLTRDELFDDGWFGPGGTAQTRGRTGDVVLVPSELVTYRDPTDPRESLVVARHGGVTSDEMHVPVAVGCGRAQTAAGSGAVRH